MSAMKERMHTGELYLPGDHEIMEWQAKCLDRLYEFNQTRPTEFKKRQTLMKEMFAEIGEGCYVEPPFHSNFGGGHVHFGKNIYANFNLTCVDDTHIYVGITQCSARMSPLLPQDIRFFRSCGRKGISIMRPFASEKTAGLVQG